MMLVPGRLRADKMGVEGYVAVAIAEPRFIPDLQAIKYPASVCQFPDLKTNSISPVVVADVLGRGRRRRIAMPITSGEVQVNCRVTQSG